MRVVDGSRGLVLGVVLGLVAEGARVTVPARNGRRLAEVAAALPVATHQGDRVDAQVTSTTRSLPCNPTC